MVRRLSRIVQMVRDVVILLLSVVLVSTDIGPGKEIANLVLAAIAGVIAALTAINMALNLLRVKRKGYYYACSYIELAVGIFFLIGLFPPYGVPLVAFNVVVLITLHEKRVPVPGTEPPPPLTRNYHILEGLAAFAILAGFLLPSISSSSFSLLGAYSSIFGLGSSAALPAISVGPVAVLLVILTLFLSPVALVTCVLGYFRRRFALLAALLAIASSAGWIIALDILSPEAKVSAGLGAYAILVGGVVALVAYLMVRRRPKTSKDPAMQPL